MSARWLGQGCTPLGCTGISTMRGGASTAHAGGASSDVKQGRMTVDPRRHNAPKALEEERARNVMPVWEMRAQGAVMDCGHDPRRPWKRWRRRRVALPAVLDTRPKGHRDKGGNGAL